MQAPATTSPNSTRRPRGRRRQITLSWDLASGLRRLSAECADERTEWIFGGPAILDESDIEALLRGQMGALAVEDHIGRCSSCQAWQERLS